jgi:hypothetical protein
MGKEKTEDGGRGFGWAMAKERIGRMRRILINYRCIYV